tara:strand:+ start:1561 stop:1752 length:192 start_codon:yes stop_codon:yes gene_type:complete
MPKTKRTIFAVRGFVFFSPLESITLEDNFFLDLLLAIIKPTQNIILAFIDKKNTILALVILLN